MEWHSHHPKIPTTPFSLSDSDPSSHSSPTQPKETKKSGPDPKKQTYTSEVDSGRGRTIICSTPAPSPVFVNNQITLADTPHPVETSWLPPTVDILIKPGSEPIFIVQTTQTTKVYCSKGKLKLESQITTPSLAQASGESVKNK
jgi:hypothetical protein